MGLKKYLDLDYDLTYIMVAYKRPDREVKSRVATWGLGLRF